MSDHKRPLRSAQWFGTADKNGFMYRSWMKNQGIPDHEFQGKPIIGICNTWSELTPCNAHFRKIAEHVKKGVLEAGGFPVEFPVFSSGESNLRPTAMLTRNLASMDVEEAIRGNPVDAVVLLTGCDKTTPALLMGAASCDVPAIVVTGGPMLNGKHKGKDIGAGTIVWQMHEAYKAGQIDLNEFLSAEAGMSRSAGTCNTMGTASTMACMAEALGTSLPHNAAIPAVDARRYVLAHLSGMRIVDMVREDLRLSKILTREAFENAIRVNAAIGGSTNAVIHLKAIAGRIGVDLQLEDWTRIGRGTPTLVDLQPSGRFLMEEFYYAGGLPAVIRRLGEHGLLPNPAALTANGKSLWDNCQAAPLYDEEVIRPLDKPLVADGDFGPGTLEAVKQFQRDHQLTVDGKAGGDTLGALDAATQQRAQAFEQERAAAEPTMASPGHADNPRYQQVVEKLEALEEQRRQGGLSPLFNDRNQLENAAGQVAYESKVAGMSQVDTVLARPDNQGVFAVQGQLGDPAMHRTYVDLSQAVNQNLQDSTRQSQALDNELSQRQTQEQMQTQQSMSR